jgi:hypothetical protein
VVSSGISFIPDYIKIHPEFVNLKQPDQLTVIKLTPNIAPLYIHRNLWRYVEDGGKSKYCVTQNFCSQTFMGTKREWRYTERWPYVHFLSIVQRKHNNNSTQPRGLNIIIMMICNVAGCSKATRTLPKKTAFFLVVKGPPADATDALQPWGLLCNPVMKMKMIIFLSFS